MQTYTNLRGKNIFITGASRGFGKAMALAFAAAGATVGLGFRRSTSRALQVKEQIEAQGGRAILCKGDIGRDEHLDQIFKILQTSMLPLHGLIANAAFGVTRPLLETNRKAFDITMHCSAWSLIAMTLRSLPLMPAGTGSIVVLSSSGAREVLPGYGLMGAAKASLENITKTLATELEPRGIRINGLIPGFVLTGSARAIKGIETSGNHEDSEEAKRMFEKTARKAAYLLSDQSQPLSGQFFSLTGNT